jgi:uncharacterized protein YpmS
MTERDYKFIIGILLTINVICLIIIAVLFGEILSLQEKLSEMRDSVRTLNDNISADQSTTDFVSQNKLISENLKPCLSSIDFINRSILNEVTSSLLQIISVIN